MAVALHPEGVDRNNFLDYNVRRMGVALHPEGVDRNVEFRASGGKSVMSPSTRRAWIEMILSKICGFYLESPSTRRAWIEIRLMKIPR